MTNLECYSIDLTKPEKRKFLQCEKHLEIHQQNCPKKMFGKLCLICYLLIVSSFSHAKVFWKKNKKRLDFSPSKSVSIKTPEACFGVCLFNKWCKSFNVRDDKCDIFDQDRCSPGIILLHDDETTYFDLVADNQCPLPSKTFTFF